MREDRGQYCADSRRRRDCPVISFTFCGYMFRPRMFTGFLPAAGSAAPPTSCAGRRSDRSCWPGMTCRVRRPRLGGRARCGHQRRTARRGPGRGRVRGESLAGCLYLALRRGRSLAQLCAMLRWRKRWLAFVPQRSLDVTLAVGGRATRRIPGDGRHDAPALAFLAELVARWCTSHFLRRIPDGALHLEVAGRSMVTVGTGSCSTPRCETAATRSTSSSTRTSSPS